MSLRSRAQNEQDLLDLAAQWEPKIRVKWTRTVRAWQKSGEVESLLSDVRAGVPNSQLLKRVDSLGLDSLELQEVLADVQLVASRAAVNKYGIDMTVQANARMRDHALERVTDMSNTARRSTKTALAQGFENGLSVNELAMSIRDSLPLDQRGVNALSNFRKAISKNPGMTPGLKARRVEEYKARLTSHRAETIARTETMFALNLGKRDTLIAAYGQDLLSADTNIEWITASDERTCPVCAPLNGQETSVGGMFVTANGPVYGPPMHPNCRCTTGVV